jgi:hypothetical protein
MCSAQELTEQGLLLLLLLQPHPLALKTDSACCDSLNPPLLLLGAHLLLLLLLLLPHCDPLPCQLTHHWDLRACQMTGSLCRCSLRLHSCSRGSRHQVTKVQQAYRAAAETKLRLAALIHQDHTAAAAAGSLRCVRSD